MTSFHLRRKIATCFALVLFSWLAGFWWFIGQIPRLERGFTENAADAIVVLTGDSGRLEYGLHLLMTGKAEKLFISGAGENVGVMDILRQESEKSLRKIPQSQIVLGHMAENTIGNAEETAKWLKNMKYSKIILVTSDYHMPRAILEFSKFMPDVKIIPAPSFHVEILSYKWLKDDNTRSLIFSEYHKYIASKLRHLFVSITQPT